MLPWQGGAPKWDTSGSAGMENDRESLRPSTATTNVHVPKSPPRDLGTRANVFRNRHLAISEQNMSARVPEYPSDDFGTVPKSLSADFGMKLQNIHYIYI